MRPKKGRLITSINFTPETWNMLPPGNVSSYVCQAVKEKHYREQTNEGKIKQLEYEKKQLAKKINEISQTQKDLES